jgi:hypothetical protein
MVVWGANIYFSHKTLISSSIIIVLFSITTNTISPKNHHKKTNNNHESHGLFFRIDEGMSQISLQTEKLYKKKKVK